MSDLVAYFSGIAACSFNLFSSCLWILTNETVQGLGMPWSFLLLPQQFLSPLDNLPMEKVLQEQLLREKRSWGRVGEGCFICQRIWIGSQLPCFSLLSFFPLSTTEDDIISLQNAMVAIFPAQLLLGIFRPSLKTHKDSITLLIRK